VTRTLCHRTVDHRERRFEVSLCALLSGLVNKGGVLWQAVTRVHVTSRWALRAEVVVLALGVLLAAAPAAAEAAEAVRSEPVATEAPDRVTLTLGPLCTNEEGLRRFAVEHVAGPATRFTVSVAGVQDGERLRLKVGEARRFWVDAALEDQVEITWPDGSATATPVEDPCAPDVGLYTDPEPAPEPSVAPAPAASDGPTQPPRRRSPRARERPLARGDTAPNDRDASPPSGGRPEERAAAPSHAAEPDRARAAPRPRRSGDDIVCPNGWVPVDRDGDARIETSDGCEVMIETASGPPPGGASITVAALVVTMMLLVASIGVGAVSRRRT
jgi:hypothetical protein